MRKLIGMIHLGALPGSPGNELEVEFLEANALEDLAVLEKAGFDAAIVENISDEPFRVNSIELETYSTYVAILRTIIKKARIKIGVSIQMNLWKEMIAASKATGASFVRIAAFTEERICAEGKIGPVAAGALRYRRAINSKVLIAADVQVKHSFSVIPEDHSDYFAQMADRFADYVVITSSSTGKAVDIEYLSRMRKILKKPIWVGSGVSEENIIDILRIADGVIVGTSIKKDGQTTNPVDIDRASRIVEEARGVGIHDS